MQDKLPISFILGSYKPKDDPTTPILLRPFFPSWSFRQKVHFLAKSRRCNLVILGKNDSREDAAGRLFTKHKNRPQKSQKIDV